MLCYVIFFIYTESPINNRNILECFKDRSSRVRKGNHTLRLNDRPYFTGSTGEIEQAQKNGVSGSRSRQCVGIRELCNVILKGSWHIMQVNIPNVQMRK